MTRTKDLFLEQQQRAYEAQRSRLPEYVQETIKKPIKHKENEQDKKDNRKQPEGGFQANG